MLDEQKFVIRHEARLFNLSATEKRDRMTTTDSKVKDFLVDSNEKFSIVKDESREINILFICWNDHTDQPCTALKHPFNGLLTKNSWYKDENNAVVTFENIDLIFVSDLYQNLFAYMNSGNIPYPDELSGVPFFQNNERFLRPVLTLNPFLLSHSRNILIEPTKEFTQEQIFNLPIAFSDQSVIVVNEDFVAKNCCEIKCSFLNAKK